MGQSAAAYEQVAPKRGSNEFATFDEIFKSTLQSSTGKALPNYSDRDVHQFTVRACISAILCDLIYLPRAKIAGALKTKSIQHPAWFVCENFELSNAEVEDTGGPFFGIFNFTSGTYVIIRGAVNSADWDTNLTYEPAEFLDQKDFVHKGFLARAKNVPLEMIARSAQDVIVAGHSLGGAAAVLVATELMSKTVNPKMVVTFGQPSCFYKDWPASLRLLGAKVKTRVHRFSFDDDIVPTSSGSDISSFHENLIRLSDSPPFVSARNLYECLPVPRVFQFEAAKHRMTRHKHALLNAACFSECVGLPKSISINEVHTFPLDIQDVECSLADGRDGGGRFLLQLTGRGKNAYITKASMCETIADSARLRTLPGTRLTEITVDINHSESHEPDTTFLAFTLTFDVTDAHFTDTTVALCLSNGFHTIERQVEIQLNNIVVFGKMAHGKSTLIRALRAYAKGEPYPSEVPRVGLGINPANMREVFTDQKFTVYEALGVGNNDDVHRYVVQTEINKMPPRVILIAWKFGEALDDKSKDFDCMVNEIMRGVEKLKNRDAVKVILVLTQCDKMHLKDWKSRYEETADELKQRFGMSQATRHFLVNSANADGDQKKVTGIDELYKYVTETLESSLPLQDTIEILSVWERFNVKVACGCGLTVAPIAARGALAAGLTVGGSLAAATVGAAVAGTTVVAATVAMNRVNTGSAPTQRLYRWMYGDVSTGWLAEVDPLRWNWSSRKSAEDTIAELRSLTPADQARPFILVDDQNLEQKRRFSNMHQVHEALATSVSEEQRPPR